MTVLAAADLIQFRTRGWCTVRGAFTAAQAAAARAVVWDRMAAKRGLVEHAPADWPPAYDIEEHLGAPAVIACFTDRLAAAVEQLVGPGRWTGERRWGFWPVNFHYGAGEPAAWPRHGWHVDGNWFTHTIDCPKQGLLLIGLFSDVPPGAGGTIVAGGSHRACARVLAAHPDGLGHGELFERVLAQPIGDFCELTGAAGDAVLAHPFLFHTRGFKRHGDPRVLSNTEVPLREPMQLERPDGDYSALELSIRDALREPAPPAPADAMMCQF